MESESSIKTDHFRCRVSFTNEKLKDDLIKFGCIPIKSKIIKYPTFLQEELERHFIRGFFDGDGCITRSHKDCMWDSATLACASKDFVDALKERLQILLNEEDVKKYKHSGKSQMWVFVFKNQKFVNFMQLIYYKANIYLDRKYERFKDSIAVLLRN